MIIDFSILPEEAEALRPKLITGNSTKPGEVLFPDNIQVTIIDDDIRKGKVGSSSECPWALAIKRSFNWRGRGEYTCAIVDPHTVYVKSEYISAVQRYTCKINHSDIRVSLHKERRGPKDAIIFLTKESAVSLLRGVK